MRYLNGINLNHSFILDFINFYFGNYLAHLLKRWIEKIAIRVNSCIKFLNSCKIHNMYSMHRHIFLTSIFIYIIIKLYINLKNLYIISRIKL